MSDGVLMFVLINQDNHGLISVTMSSLLNFPPEIGDCGLR